MLVLLSDTHGTDDHRLTGRTLEAVREADLVAHAGDFTTEAVLSAFRDLTGRFDAVHGNADRPAVSDRLPTALTFEYGGVRFAMTHRRRGGDTGLVMFGRERNANVVVHGHTHRPRFDDSGAVALLNPGSHADPRGNRPAHAELEPTDGGLAGRLVTPDGDVLTRFDLG
jgi:putative phosphoesterase